MADTKGCKTARWSESHQSQSKFGSQSATRLREGGVASNRGSACRGEYVPGPCTHRPSHHESRQYPKQAQLTPCGTRSAKVGWQHPTDRTPNQRWLEHSSPLRCTALGYFDQSQIGGGFRPQSSHCYSVFRALGS